MIQMPAIVTAMLLYLQAHHQAVAQSLRYRKRTRSQASLKWIKGKWALLCFGIWDL